MSARFAVLSPILRKVGDRLAICCPGCNSHHVINVFADRGPRWTWNNSADRPTFTPSLLVTYNGPDAGMDQSDGHRAPPAVCHSFVTDGRIQFLGDCTHHLVGQTVDLPPFDSHADD